MTATFADGAMSRAAHHRTAVLRLLAEVEETAESDAPKTAFVQQQLADAFAKLQGALAALDAIVNSA